jgi:hypothetical protein
VCVCVIAGTGGIHSLAWLRGLTRERSVLRSCLRWIVRTAAGVSWTSPTTSAPWAGRRGHTTVIDAAGTIYVIGGQGTGDTRYQDVWASTDGGTDRTQSGCSGFSEGGLAGYFGLPMVLRGTRGVLRGSLGIQRAFTRGTRGVHEGCHAVFGVLPGPVGVL